MYALRQSTAVTSQDIVHPESGQALLFASPVVATHTKEINTMLIFYPSISHHHRTERRVEDGEYLQYHL